MKKLIFMLCMAAIAAGLSGCQKVAKMKLAITCENTNNYLPIDLGAIGSFTALEYDHDDNNVTFTYEVNEDISDISSLNTTKEVQKQSIGTFLKSGESKQMLERMVWAKATLTVVFHGTSSGQEFNVTFTPDELQQLADTAVDASDSSQLRLDTMIKANAAQCPMDLGDGMILTTVLLEDGYMTYHYTVTGEDYDFTDEDMPTIKETVGDSLSDTFSGHVGARIVQILLDTDTGVRYVYHNTDNSQDYTITFSSEEFASLVNAE